MSSAGDLAPDRDALPIGTRVEVRNAFGSWSGGFSIEAMDTDGYRLRRRSDDLVLPATFSVEDVRRERKSMWWV